MSVDAFFSKLNPALAILLRSPLHWLASPFLMLVTIKGRRTGATYTIPVGYQRDGADVITMVSEAHEKQWWRNFREPGRVVLRLRGREIAAGAALVDPATPEFRDRAESTLRRVPGMARVFRVDFDRKAGLTDLQVAHLAQEIAIVRFRPEPAKP